MKRFFWLLLAALILASPLPAWAEGKTGVLVMHGKQGMPDRGVLTLANKLQAAGFLVLSLEMPWSKKRDFDKSYTEGLAEIEEDIARLQAMGADKIALAGHSLGANAALAYASQRKGADALVLLAPGHNPNLPGIQKRTAQSVDKAKAMVAEGKGDSLARFDDVNQGQKIEVNTKAAIYLSYMDPEGLGSMPLTASKIPAPLPALYVVGDKDPLSSQGRTYIFDKLPAHPASRYLEVEADHVSTPDKAADAVIDWLKNIAK